MITEAGRGSGTDPVQRLLGLLSDPGLWMVEEAHQRRASLNRLQLAESHDGIRSHQPVAEKPGQHRDNPLLRVAHVAERSNDESPMPSVGGVDSDLNDIVEHQLVGHPLKRVADRPANACVRVVFGRVDSCELLKERSSSFGTSPRAT